MRHFLFAPTISYWQYLTMMTAFGCAWIGGVTIWSLPLFFAAVAAGAAIEGFVQGVARG